MTIPTDKTNRRPRNARVLTKPAGQPGAGASKGQAAIRIGSKSFIYTREQRDQIRTVLRNALGLDADQIEISTPRYGEQNSYAMYSLWDRLEAAASMYPLRRAAKDQSLSRNELVALRQKVKALWSEINDALAVPILNTHFKAGIILPGVHVSMPTETDDYFRKLLLTLDRLIEQAGQPSDNARKTDRDPCWDELLAIWCGLGGKATGKAAASFLVAASRPVMGSAVPSPASVEQELKRRQDRTGNKVTKRVRRITR